MPEIEAHEQLQALQPSAMVSMFIIDATGIGGSFLRFYPGTNGASAPLVWQGNTYQPYPIDVKGMEITGQQAPPRPSLFVSNIGGVFSELCRNFNDLIGAKVTRKRTWAQYLDGMPGADSTIALPDDAFYIDRKVSENKLTCEFELTTNMAVDDLTLPRRRVWANLCAWKYRGGECGFTGAAVAGVDDEAFVGPIVDKGAWSIATAYVAKDAAYILGPDGLRRYFYCILGHTGQEPPNTTYWVADLCSKRVQGCSLRFRLNGAGLPFGGFPGTKRVG